ncbi:MAG: EboA domain-containing protein [Egibacteraceae bacterium]
MPHAETGSRCPLDRPAAQDGRACGGVTYEQLEAAVRRRTTPPQRAWLDEARRAVAADPSAIGSCFPAVGRQVGRGPLDPTAELDDLHAWRVDDAARTLLLLELGDRVGGQLELLYRHGDTAERRGVLRALALLPAGDAGIRLVEDAVRTNDPRLIAAALGPYAMARLDDATLCHAVLKCVFSGVPLGGLEGLSDRVTPDMARLLASYAHERVVAGRGVALDVWPIIDRFPPEAELAAIEAELGHPARS